MGQGGESIVKTHPHLVSEWADEKDISTVSKGSDYSAKWECSKGHEWITKVCNRVNSKGCPFCANKRILAGFNDLVTTHPHLAEEWNDDLNEKSPFQVTAGSDKRAHWKCRDNEDHKWETSILGRKQGSGCPYCSGHRAARGVSDFATLYPELLKEWFDDAKDPFEMLPQSGYRAQWKCKINALHVWRIAISNRTMRNSGCPYCSGRRCSPGISDLATTHPHLVSEWDDVRDISTVSYSSMYKAKWKCEIGHTWTMSPNRRINASGYVGCLYCSSRKLLVGYNDVLTTHPHLLEEWFDESDMQDYTAINMYKAKWKCKKSQHVYFASLNNRAKYGTGCMKCWKESYSSKAEQELYEYVFTLVNGKEVEQNDRKVIAPKELDIYIPGLSIAFEFNGIYWHSDEVIENRTGLTAAEYHAIKKSAAKEQGIDLFFVWEDDWLSQRDVVEQAVFDAVVNKKRDSPLLSILSKS